VILDLPMTLDADATLVANYLVESFAETETKTKSESALQEKINV